MFFRVKEVVFKILQYLNKFLKEPGFKFQIVFKNATHLHYNSFC